MKRTSLPLHRWEFTALLERCGRVGDGGTCTAIGHSRHRIPQQPFPLRVSIRDRSLLPRATWGGSVRRL